MNSVTDETSEPYSDVNDRPAVGFVATEDNTDALVRAVAQAQSRKHACLVAYSGETMPKGAALAEHVGATVVKPSSDVANPERLKDVLVGVARAHSYPGLIVASVSCPEIDYARSVETLESSDQFSSEAVTRESPVDAALETVVVIPAYNEEQTVGTVARDAMAYADEVLVVDDGSDDDTASVARDAGATVITHGTNQGYGASLKTAFREGDKRDADHLVVLDGDGQHDPSDVPRLVEPIERDDADVVIGSRFGDGATSDLPRYRWAGLKAINGLTNLSMGILRPRSWVTDTQSGFRAYSARAVQSLANDDGIGDQMNASTDILYHAHEHGYDVEEVGTTIAYDVENASSHNPVKHGLTLVSNVLQTIEKERPVMIFGVPGFIFTLIGVGLVYWAISNYVATATLPVGLAIAAVFVSLAGILACFTAIILHSLTIHFEDATTARKLR